MNYKPCRCKWCVTRFPLLDRLTRVLGKRDGKLVRRLVCDLLDAEDQLGAANAKLAGTWPGWEWLPKEIRRRVK